jgi:hypothetical protein
VYANVRISAHPANFFLRSNGNLRSQKP